MPCVDQQRREQDDQAKENEKNRNEAAEQHRIQFTFRDVTSAAGYRLGYRVQWANDDARSDVAGLELRASYVREYHFLPTV